jgi:hypothetical protein
MILQNGDGIIATKIVKSVTDLELMKIINAMYVLKIIISIAIKQKAMEFLAHVIMIVLIMDFS